MEKDRRRERERTVRGIGVMRRKGQRYMRANGCGVVERVGRIGR